MKIAGIMQTRNYRDDCKAFHFLKQMCDVVIVLDHNSHKPFPFINQCDVYMAMERKGLWNCTTNQTTLFYQAFSLGCEWIVRLDDDMIPGAGFQKKQDALRLIDDAIQRGVDVIKFELRDLWDGPDQYRADGIWVLKNFPVIQRNWFFNPQITLQNPQLHRLHQIISPVNQDQTIVNSPLPIYHAGCMTMRDRIERVEKYRIQDEANIDGYRYMLELAGIRLAQVPKEDRACFPPCFTS